MESRNSKVSSDGSDNSIRNMIDEAKEINERGRRSAAGARFMSELLDYITSESKRRATPVHPDARLPNTRSTLSLEAKQEGPGGNGEA